jgi:threonine aldolase
MIIDLRSDTVTKPSKEMLAAMMSAEVGDDVFGDDPTVVALENKAAAMFGLEAGLFCVSGTQTNQLGIKAQTQSGQEVICDKYAHIYLYEGGGLAVNSQLSVALLDGNRGRITAEQVSAAINNPEDIHRPITSMISVENTMNKGGGSIYEMEELQKIKEVCKQNDLIFHLDGARIFNAIVAKKQNPAEYGKMFDSISICLSKGLGCPVGSVLLGSKAMIKKARRQRKAMGGGWRQAGFLAAAGIYALENNIERLEIDHERAKKIGQVLESKSFVKEIYPIDTNIVIFKLIDSISENDFVMKAKENGLLCVTFGKSLVRFVTHLDFTDEHLVEFENVINKIILN